MNFESDTEWKRTTPQVKTKQIRTRFSITDYNNHTLTNDTKHGDDDCVANKMSKCFIVDKNYKIMCFYKLKLNRFKNKYYERAKAS